MSKKHEDMFVLCNCWLKGELSRGEFNNQVNKMTHFEDNSQSLSPATHCPWTNEQSGHGGRDGSYVWPQQHKIPLIKADSWLPNLPEAKTNIKPLIKPHFQGDRQVGHIGLLPFWKEQHFVLTEINTYSGYRFAFSAYRGQNLYVFVIF